jgi:hypothetical protein
MPFPVAPTPSGELCRVSMSVAVSLASLSISTNRISAPSLALKLIYFSDLLRDAAIRAAHEDASVPSRPLTHICDDSDRVGAVTAAVAQALAEYEDQYKEKE